MIRQRKSKRSSSKNTSSKVLAKTASSKKSKDDSPEVSFTQKESQSSGYKPASPKLVDDQLALVAAQKLKMELDKPKKDFPEHIDDTDF